MPAQPNQLDRMDHQNTEWMRSNIVPWLLGLFFFMGSVWGCGSDQPIDPTAFSSNQSIAQWHSNAQQAEINGSGAYQQGDVVPAAAVNPEKVKLVKDYLQQLRDAEPEDRENVLMDGLTSPDPDIRFMALNDKRFGDRLSWDTQARSDLQQMLQYEADPGMRRRMEDLLAKGASQSVQSTHASAAQY